MEDTPSKAANPKGWTEGEKAGLLIQIIARAGKIPWDELDLPEGRTVKACQVMVDREKQKLKSAREAEGKDSSGFDGRKRKPADNENGVTPKAKKPKTPRKKKEKVVMAGECEEEEEEEQEGKVKVEGEMDQGADE